jgi:hypothetical protein
MKPIDFRNATFADVRNRIIGQRYSVLEAWRVHGPGTTAELAARSGLSILTLRPRTTELVQLGYVMLCEEQRPGHEGTYRVRTDDELVTWLTQRQAIARGEGVQTTFF